jgi:hypothetical protein
VERISNYQRTHLKKRKGGRERVREGGKEGKGGRQGRREEGKEG